MAYKNDTISDPIEVPNAFNDYFINIGTNIILSYNDSNTFNQMVYQKYLHTPSDTPSKFVRITEMDVLQLINKMDNKSSSRHDRISNRILKSLKNIICKPIALIINQMTETGVFLTFLKFAKTIPLYKKVTLICHQTIDQFRSCLLYQNFLNVLYIINCMIIL